MPDPEDTDSVTRMERVLDSIGPKPIPEEIKEIPESPVPPLIGPTLPLPVDPSLLPAVRP